MKFSRTLWLVAFAALFPFPFVANAQYLRITTDNPTDGTRMRASGTTILTLTLDTTHDRNGALQTCNSHSSASCGSSTTAQPLDMFSYTLALKAVGGTVSWGTFTAADASYTDTSPQIQSDTEVEINKARPTGTVTPPGLATLGTLAVTVASGSPGIQVQVGASTLNPFGFGTAFGTGCEAFFFPNTYVIGDPADPCGDVTGVAGDWFDWDGALSASGNTLPSIQAPPSALASENAEMSPLTATATDPDAGTTISITQSGMPASLTFSSTPGPSPNTASISGTPGFDDAGTHGIHWVADDGGGGTATATTSLTITNVDRPPVLTQPANMTVDEIGVVNQTLFASDPDGDAVFFSKVAGPTYMTVSFAPGNIRLAPGYSDAGTASATVRALANGLFDEKSFSITVFNNNRRPTLDFVSDMTVMEGATSNQLITGSDPDGDPLTFSLAQGPSFATVTTTTSTSGNIHLAPGTTAATGSPYDSAVLASDGDITLPAFRNFQITVIAGPNETPTLAHLSDMTVNEGDLAEQTLTATDPDGDALAFTKAAGPTYMTVYTRDPGRGTGTGFLSLVPGFQDAGTALAAVRASDGTASDEKSFSITVNDVNRAPLADAGGPYSGVVGIPVNFDGTASSDPDGDALLYSWSFGDGESGVGAAPSHAYGTAGDFVAVLTVSDVVPQGSLSDSDITAVHVQGMLAALAFPSGGDRVLKLKSGKPSFCIGLQPVESGFALPDVDISSLVLRSEGTGDVSEIHSLFRKPGVVQDANKDGVPDVPVCFLKVDLRLLFSKVIGTQEIPAELSGRVRSGALFSAPITLTVTGTSDGLAASVSPNPLNPNATLTFELSRGGMVRVEVFDPGGKLVRQASAATYYGPGVHEIPLDGRDRTGSPLASGVYFYRLQAPEGNVTGRFAVLK